MNFIQKIQKLFHVNKWWGRALFILLFYLLSGFLFYGGWLLIISPLREYEYDIYRTYLSLVSLFLHLILPIVSFFIVPKFFRNFIKIKHPYFINSIAVILIIGLFVFFEILIGIKNFFEQGLL